MNKKSLTALIILDGFGYRKESEFNAIRTDGAEHIMALKKQYPHSLIGASGLDVGLPEGQMGNSEVGHTNIGAGRVVYQDIVRINEAIKNGDFFCNPTFLGAAENCREHGSALHIMGLLSDGGVHSTYEHIVALLRFAKQQGLEKVYVHCFTDGRDTPTDSGVGFVANLMDDMREIGVGRIATVGGRYYAMDRNSNFDRVEKAYAAMVYGEGVKAFDPVEAMRASYAAGVTDEFVLPTVITDEFGSPVAAIGENDSIIFANFRADRARIITSSFIFEDFDGFERKNGFFPVYFACMTEYRADFAPFVHIAFAPQSLKNGMGEYVSSLGLTQLRIAEYEKYAHVTFFFNGGVEEPYKGEDRILVPSPKVATYDLKPEMSAIEVTDKVVEAIKSGKYDFIILNYANCDMVGHTGVFPAVIKAVETVDTCVGRFVDAIREVGGEVCITADHGNADQMMDYENDQPFTKHTTNPVPLIVAGAGKDIRLKEGRLCDLCPTMLDIMKLEKPEQMSGVSLIER